MKTERNKLRLNQYFHVEKINADNIDALMWELVTMINEANSLKEEIENDSDDTD